MQNTISNVDINTSYLQLFAMSWSPDGQLLATIAKDHIIRIYDPRSSTSPVNEGEGPEGAVAPALCG